MIIYANINLDTNFGYFYISAIFSMITYKKNLKITQFCLKTMWKLIFTIFKIIYCKIYQKMSCMQTILSLVFFFKVNNKKSICKYNEENYLVVIKTEFIIVIIPCLYTL